MVSCLGLHTYSSAVKIILKKLKTLTQHKHNTILTNSRYPKVATSQQHIRSNVEEKRSSYERIDEAKDNIERENLQHLISPSSHCKQQPNAKVPLNKSRGQIHIKPALLPIHRLWPPARNVHPNKPMSHYKHQHITKVLLNKSRGQI